MSEIDFTLKMEAAVYFEALHPDSEDSNFFPRNFGTCPPNYTASRAINSSNIRGHCFENLKFHVNVCVFSTLKKEVAGFSETVYSFIQSYMLPQSRRQ